MKAGSCVLKIILVLALVSGIFAASARAEGDRFRLCVIKYDGAFAPHPGALENIARYLKATTSIDPPEKINFVPVDDEIFKYPFLYIAAKGKMPVFGRQKIALLARHLASGGFLLIDEASSYGAGDFMNSLERFAQQVIPDSKLEKIPPEDVIFKAFYLKPKAAGRVDNSPYLYGVRAGVRWAIVYSPDDLAGAWARDEAGRFLYPCTPGGEPQRLEAIKLTVNIIMYSLTGTYKQDIIHKKFIEMKLRSW